MAYHGVRNGSGRECRGHPVPSPRDRLGAFVQLFASATDFVQAAPEAAGPRRRAFRRRHGVSPWVLQFGYGQERPRQVFQAEGLLSWYQVRQALLSFLGGGEEWRRQFTWEELPHPKTHWWRFW